MDLNKKPEKKKKKESPLLNLGLNILLPTIILMRFSKEEYLGATNGLIVALAFPIIYGIYEFAIAKKVNFFSILGFVSILITGTVGLLELDAHWIAVKEAAIPLLIGLAVLISLRTPYPLVKKLLFNDQLMKIDLINEKLAEKGNVVQFEKRLVNSSYMLAGSFLFSAILNYVLAKIILKSPSGTEAFNEELGQMTSLSFPVIALPSTIILMLVLWFLINGVRKLTDLEFNDIFNIEG